MDYVVYGLQRSGTNFLEKLIKSSFNNVDIKNAYEYNAPWKHAFDIHHDIETKTARIRQLNGEAQPYKSHHPFVVETYDYWIARLREVNAILITKHPFTWIDSVTKKNVDMKRFKLYNTNNDPLMFAEIYKQHALFWREQRRHQQIFKLPYENLIRAPGNALMYTRLIGEFFGDKHNGFDGIPNKVNMSDKFSEEKRNKYVNIETNLSPAIQKDVLNIIGNDILEDYGYRTQKP